ncbi:MAG: Hsp70 family protein [Gemmataceae bacterium]
MSTSRYVVGIDLGTTNCAVFYVDTGAGEGADTVAKQFLIPQVTRQGVVEERPLLPSFLYLPLQGEQPAGSLDLPWEKAADFAVGTYARDFGSQVPTRLVSSAKSWLCHDKVDRHQPILPWKAPDDARLVSPVEASTLYLKHIAHAWNQTIAKDVEANRLEHQEIILTVPASFDAVAKELTVEGARHAGIEHLTLLEEPQAAVYSWILTSGDQWRDQVRIGDAILVCDIGGGTTDFTLIAVGEENGNLVLTRVAVGDHILLGGDNMDLALAHAAAQQFTDKGAKLDHGQMLQLWHSCRAAKEQLFANPELDKAKVTVLGRGRKVIGGTLHGEISRDQVHQVMVDGFFPPCEADVQPKQQRQMGLQELGLPYAADPAVSKHLAYFLRRHSGSLMKHAVGETESESRTMRILFNGGVFKAAALQDRLIELMSQWGQFGSEGGQVQALEGVDLDMAVARGAAYYGLARRGRGIRIRGGTARTYYIGIESSLPAVPGIPSPLKALCVVPYGMEEGTEAEVPGPTFGLVVGEPVEFRFLASNVRKEDEIGALVEDYDDDIDELNPLSTNLAGEGEEGRTVPVRLHSKVNETGTLELWCHSEDGKEQWKLEFNVRERKE